MTSFTEINNLSCVAWLKHMLTSASGWFTLNFYSTFTNCHHSWVTKENSKAYFILKAERLAGWKQLHVIVSDGNCVVTMETFDNWLVYSYCNTITPFTGYKICYIKSWMIFSFKHSNGIADMMVSWYLVIHHQMSILLS